MVKDGQGWEMSKANCNYIMVQATLALTDNGGLVWQVRQMMIKLASDFNHVPTVDDLTHLIKDLPDHDREMVGFQDGVSLMGGSELSIKADIDREGLISTFLGPKVLKLRPQPIVHKDHLVYDLWAEL